MDSILPKLPSAIRPKGNKKKTKEINIGRGPGVIGSSGVLGGDGGEGGGGMMGESNEKKFTYTYSCAMLNLSDSINYVFTYWARKMIPEEDLFINLEQGMEGYEDMPHVTVKYGIHDSNPKRLENLIKGFGPVHLKFGIVSKFTTNPDLDVLKVEVDGPKLYELNKKISDNMENTDIHEYNPHATLAFVKKGACEHLVGNDFFDKLNDFVNEVYFTTRTGEEFFIKL